MRAAVQRMAILLQTQKKLFQHILKTFQKLQSNIPDSTGLHLKLATALDSIGEYKQALTEMDSLIKKDSINYGLWYTKGSIAEDAGDTLLAMKSYDNAAAYLSFC
jgi:tetratricopeptide (TPR) repeat protein